MKTGHGGVAEYWVAPRASLKRNMRKKGYSKRPIMRAAVALWLLPPPSAPQQLLVEGVCVLDEFFQKLLESILQERNYV